MTKYTIRQQMKLNAQGREVRDGWCVVDTTYGMQIEWAPTKAEAQRIAGQLNAA